MRAVPGSGSDRLAAIAAVATVGVGSAFRLRTISLPTETLTSRYLADDYFYYLNVAWNLAAGYGSSFDAGQTTTNGYQPLFLWLLAGVVALGASKIAAIQAGLIIQAAASAVASLLAYRMLAASGTAWAGVAAAAVISLNLFFILPSLTGFEMSLALALMLAAARAWQRGRPPLIVGLWCGLAVLARMDSLALACAFGVLLLGPDRRRDLRAFAIGVIAVSGPWLLWNWVAFGNPMPGSGVIKAQYRGGDDVLAALVTAANTLPRILLPGRVVDWLAGVGRRDTILVALLVATFALRGAAIKDVRPLAIAALGLLTAYVFLIGASEPGALVRYLYPVFAIAAILAFAYAGALAPGAGAGVVLVVLALHVADLAVYMRWERTAPLQLTYVGASHTLAPAAIDRLPETDRIGAFDAGALGYFASRPVINLDGLVNHDIVELQRTCPALSGDCYRPYFQSKGITVLAGGTGFGWTIRFPDWQQWERLYESPPLVDGSRLVIVRIP